MSGHCNGHSHGVSGRKLGWAVGLTLGFVVCELIAGWWAHSLALVSDGGHNFADAAALGFSWYAVWIARKPSNASMTYGYHRVGILAALVNAVSLVVIALVIFWQAIGRLADGRAVNGWVMSAAAAVGIGVNLLIALWLHGGAQHDINVRSARLHMIGDAISAAGVMAAGIFVLVFKSGIADPIVSFLIGGLILWSSWGILKESVGILLEASPAGLDVGEVADAICGTPGVVGAHDLHVWTVGPGATACSVHILVAEQTVREGQQILRAVVEMLQERFHINHSTIQVEVEGHESNEMYCSIEGSAQAGHRH